MSSPPTASISSARVRELDRFAIEELGMPGVLLMENAGRGVAEFVQRERPPGRALIACGPGNNGGDGFVIARHLDLAGWSVDVLLVSSREASRGDAAMNLGWLSATGCRLMAHDSDEARAVFRDHGRHDLVIDAILGTGSRGALRAPLGTLLGELNRRRALRVAVDLPTGVDSDTGAADPAAFRADHTCTFVAPKPGLLHPTAQPFVGKLTILGIGVPRQVLLRFGVDVPEGPDGPAADSESVGRRPA
jgi:NAD(P)H-hydrate epimerase